MTETAKSKNLLRRLPQVGLLMESAAFGELADEFSRAEVLSSLRSEVSRLREGVRLGIATAEELTPEAIHARAADSLRRDRIPYYRRVINATGVILHTGLGRSPLSPRASGHLAELAPHPVRVEIDLDSGKRGGRDEGCACLLRRLTGAGGATVVNNNAAATLVILSALARGREVLVSRGELVEIGGSYRIPEIMAESGAVLREVGTTNRTHLRDYRDALGENSALILKVHTSNYKVRGFTGEVGIEELAALGSERGVPVVHDLGSGRLVDLDVFRDHDEPRVQSSLETGASLVCCSGDKLLGGPQAGLIVGRRDLVDRCRRSQLFRAVRPGRLTYLALEATLRLYLEGEEEAVREIPVLRRLAAGAAELEDRARRLCELLRKIPGAGAQVVPCVSEAGSGSLPTVELASYGVRLELEGKNADELARELRRGDPAILGRVHDGALLLDLRTLDDDELPLLAAGLRGLA